MADSNSIAELMSRLQTRHESAAATVFELYFRRLVGLARRRLSNLVRQKVGPEDVAQSVLKSFFRRQADGEFKFEDGDALWGLLTIITLRKSANARIRYAAKRRDAAKEIAPNDNSPGSDPICNIVGHEPAPEDVTVLIETMELMMKDLSERDRTIVVMRLQGFELTEIAATADCALATVKRVLTRIRQRLK